MRVSAGLPEPLGASFDGRGTNFALFSANAEKVVLCLFDDDGSRERTRIALPERNTDIWHGYLPDVTPGTPYGYRIYGAYEPIRGLRFNSNKLLLDPYARRLSQAFAWNDAHLGYRSGNPRADLSFDRRDNARYMPKALVPGPAGAGNSNAQGRPRVPWPDTIIYEAHVKGFTQLREDVPPGWRGTFRALAAPAIVDHLRQLGVTTIELLPIHTFIDEPHLVRRGLTNYWGYNPLCFSVPDARYARGDACEELRATVARLHDAGIEVVLDVVYNHTAEGDELGPTLSFRGIDNSSYYWLRKEAPRYYENFTGTGNSLNVSHPRVCELVMDSLRHWVQAMDVDGFRFDLATTLGRAGSGGFDPESTFFSAIRQDPVLAGVKLIAEPWDIGPGGYRLGDFPPDWSEWNDRFRRALRGYWTGTEHEIARVADAMSGSASIFDRPGRSPRASVNFVTVHDGFTLADLVSYERKHNEANREDNRDGSDDNQSTNCGHEGTTQDPAILQLRRQLRRNFLASVLLAQGVPHLLAGDEVGNSQGGNNNPYCQDNATGWVDWSALGREGEDLTALIAELTALRRRFPQLCPESFRRNQQSGAGGEPLWVTPQGAPMTQDDWDWRDARFLSYLLAAADGETPPLYIVLNASPQAIDLKLPTLAGCKRWTLLLDTAQLPDRERTHDAGGAAQAPARSVQVFVGAT